MQTPVRFYITESDDRPVVRTIPVAVRVTEPRSVVSTTPMAANDHRDQPRVRVARLVRSAVKRNPANKA
jgi:hypothetical protein